MINPENLTWEPLMKVHLSNERDCSATSVIYEFELNYDAVTNKTNILEATNFGERFISGSCLGPCRWAMLASISSSPWDEGRTSTPNWDILVSWQREKRDGRTRPCLLKLLLRNGMCHCCSHFISQTKSYGQGGIKGKPSVGWESINFTQGWKIDKKK